MEWNNFQRIGSVSNAHVGNEFEECIKRLLARDGIELATNFSVPIGIAEIKKPHRFDLGSNNPAVLVECKSHAWTATGNIPSAKLTVWNEAMYYFAMAPPEFRKMFFALRHMKGDLSLASHYVRCYGHMIPSGVEIWECEQETENAVRIK